MFRLILFFQDLFQNIISFLFNATAFPRFIGHKNITRQPISFNVQVEPLIYTLF